MPIDYPIGTISVRPVAPRIWVLSVVSLIEGGQKSETVGSVTDGLVSRTLGTKDSAGALLVIVRHWLVYVNSMLVNLLQWSFLRSFHRLEVMKWLVNATLIVKFAYSPSGLTVFPVPAGTLMRVHRW